MLLVIGVLAWYWGRLKESDRELFRLSAAGFGLFIAERLGLFKRGQFKEIDEELAKGVAKLENEVKERAKKREEN